jgi:hypothetical protein
MVSRRAEISTIGLPNAKQDFKVLNRSIPWLHLQTASFRKMSLICSIHG